MAMKLKTEMAATRARRYEYRYLYTPIHTPTHTHARTASTFMCVATGKLQHEDKIEIENEKDR